jgi:hypothetical protein
MRRGLIPAAVSLILLGVVAGWASAGDAPPVAPPPTRTPTPKADLPRQTIDLGDGVTFEMVRIPAGEFDMGSPEEEIGRAFSERRHRVRITKPFWLATTEMTRTVWAVVGEKRPRHVWRNATIPACGMTWYEVEACLKRLNERVPSGGFRLPTEAEWEYACRAGTTSRFCFGDDESVLAEYAWFDPNSRGLLHPVGRRKPNAWGLHDLHGNAWEWCADWWHFQLGSDEISSDPLSTDEAFYRVIRGGSRNVTSEFLRSASRGAIETGYRARHIGDAPPQEAPGNAPPGRPPAPPAVPPAEPAAKVDLTWIPITSREHLLREVEAACNAGKATVVQVWADWSRFALFYDELMQTDPDVAGAFSRLHRLRLDLSSGDVPWEESVRSGLGIPHNVQPFMVFIDAQGRIRRDLDMSGWKKDRPAAELLRRAEAVLRDP